MNTETKTYPDLMTEQELIEYLRISEVKRSNNPNNPKRYVQRLKSLRGLPRISMCNSTLYPLKAIREWVDKQVYTS